MFALGLLIHSIVHVGAKDTGVLLFICLVSLS